MLKKGSSLALLSAGVDILEGWDNSSIVWWSLWREGTISFTQDLEDVRSALGWGRKGGIREQLHFRVWFAPSLLSSVSTGIQQEHSCRREQVTGLLALGEGSTVTSLTAIPHTAPHWTQFVVMKSFVSKMSVPVSGQALHCLFVKIIFKKKQPTNTKPKNCDFSRAVPCT